MNQILQLIKKSEINPDLLDKLFNHHTTATLLGAGVGAGTGALASKNKLKGALSGAGIGAIGGLAASHMAPNSSEALNEFLVKHLVRKPLGRVLTNIAPPVGYDTSTDIKEEVKHKGILNMLKGIIKDQPIYDTDNIQDREVPYRKNFDLNPRFGENAYKSNPNGTLSFNPEDKHGLMDLIEILDPNVTQHSVLKNYLRSHNEDGSIHYKDVWDWDLHRDNPNDKLNNPQNLARYLINRVAKPSVIEGDVSMDVLKPK